MRVCRMLATAGCEVFRNAEMMCREARRQQKMFSECFADADAGGFEGEPACESGGGRGGGGGGSGGG